ncbi:pentapeptide repeat-containing protein [Streptomyces sp. GC420]|uniref:pentapeptide repeat-containing protein n=1 Tax=Streptomyces sp. GC420 TaxID=2697568 RepID=UPI001414DDA6|nr:pentapeptide repeat-containing protein [Streptomyces sp. GC420]NBM15934.1 hypothetical protein [Streptomyces sp. GC420]
MFNWVSVGQTRTELQIAEQAQVTTRFNVAVTHLGSSSADVRFGGIYALERIMQDSPRDQPRVIAVLSAYVRTHAPAPAGGFPRLKVGEVPPPGRPDVTAVTEVLAERPPGQDGQEKINWRNSDLRGLELSTQRHGKERGGDPSAARHLPFADADLSGADLQRATLTGVNLHGALCSGTILALASFLDVDLREARLYGADLTRAFLQDVRLGSADLSDASLVDASLSGTDFTEVLLVRADLTGARLNVDQLNTPTSLTRADLTGANLTRASLAGANLTGANLGPNEKWGTPAANLTRADLTGANLTRASLAGANLTGANLGPNQKWGTPAANLAGADLTGANLAGADLTGANLAGADLTGADLTGADLTGADLTGADLTGANLRGVHLKGARTDEAVGLPSATGQ